MQNTTTLVPMDSLIPLNDEELYNFQRAMGLPDKEATNKLITTVSNFLSEIIKNNQLAINKIIEDLTKTIDRNSSAIEALANEVKNGRLASDKKSENPLFYSTISAAEMSKWKKNILRNVTTICINKDRNEGDAYNTIYDGMKNAGYDVAKLIKEYRRLVDPNAAIIDMCSHSDILRLAFQNQINHIFFGNYKQKMNNKISKKNRGVVTYRESHTCPVEIRNIVSSMSRSGYPAGATFRKAKDLLINVANIDTAKIKQETEKKYEISSCNFWFAVAQYPELVETLKEIAKGV